MAIIVCHIYIIFIIDMHCYVLLPTFIYGTTFKINIYNNIKHLLQNEGIIKQFEITITITSLP